MNLNGTVARTFVYILIAIAFVVAGFFIVTYAAGYSIDFKSRQISKTGLVSIQVQTEDTQIYLNSELIGTKSTTLRNLEPGKYFIEVTRDGFWSWSKSIELNEQEAISVGNIILFRKDAPTEPYSTGGITIGNIGSIADENGISTHSGEIFVDDEMITRFSTEVSGLSWYPSNRYISFTTDGVLYIMSTDGTNLVKLAEKTSESPAVFTNSGKFVVFENNGQIFRSQIR